MHYQFITVYRCNLVVNGTPQSFHILQCIFLFKSFTMEVIQKDTFTCNLVSLYEHTLHHNAYVPEIRKNSNKQ